MVDAFTNIEDEVSKIMNNIDINNDGYIDYNEFILTAFDKNKVFNEVQLKNIFDIIDLVIYLIIYNRMVVVKLDLKNFKN